MALSDAATIGGCAAHARQLLPCTEADMLLCRALDVPRSHIYAFPERNIAAAPAKRLAQWVERRRNGEPVAYILGERGFWGLDLAVTPDVLIPRPDTETLVAAALTRIRADARVHDLGTGSGRGGIGHRVGTARRAHRCIGHRSPLHRALSAQR